jgi:hypothetical protein
LRSPSPAVADLILVRSRWHVMDLRWLRLMLRVAAAALLVAALGSVVHGDLSFQTQEQATPNGYSIDHVVGLGHTSLILFFASAVFFVVSFMIPSKRI